MLSVGDSQVFFVSIDLVAGWQRNERSIGRERCYWVLQKWKENMFEEELRKEVSLKILKLREIHKSENLFFVKLFASTSLD